MGVSESKIAFKQSVFKLIGDKVLQPDDDIFTTYWTVPERVDDVFDLLVGADVRVLTCTDASELGGAKADPRRTVLAYDQLGNTLVQRRCATEKAPARRRATQ